LESRSSCFGSPRGCAHRPHCHGCLQGGRRAHFLGVSRYRLRRPRRVPAKTAEKSQQHTPDEVCIDSFQPTELRTTVIAPLRLVSCSPISTARSITTGGPRPCRTLSILISAEKKELVQYLRSSLPDRGTLTSHSEAHAWIARRCLHRLLARVDAEIWVHATGQSNQQRVNPVVPV
jgi:hypothetical protein